MSSSDPPIDKLSLSSSDPPFQYAEALKATVKDTILIKLKPESKPSKWQSKVGGEPYLPLTESYPLNSNEEPLLFLAQINFNEVPHIEGYPETGILQFYIDAEDDLMGLESNEHQVLYFKDVETDESKLHETLPKLNFPIGPLEHNKPLSMEFHLEKQYMSSNDYRFDDISELGDNYDMFDEYSRLFPSNGHRIGGYPCFTQSDPRTSSNEWKDHELLFQLDSDGDIMWGDMGVGAFFIKPDDLKKLDFSNVLYNWDCC